MCYSICWRLWKVCAVVEVARCLLKGSGFSNFHCGSFFVVDCHRICIQIDSCLGHMKHQIKAFVAINSRKCQVRERQKLDSLIWPPRRFSKISLPRPPSTASFIHLPSFLICFHFHNLPRALHERMAYSFSATSNFPSSSSSSETIVTVAAVTPVTLNQSSRDLIAYLPLTDLPWSSSKFQAQNRITQNGYFRLLSWRLRGRD